MAKDDWPVLERKIAEECSGYLVFLLLMIGCFKKGKECSDDLGVFWFLIQWLVFRGWQRNVTIITGCCFKEDKKYAAHLVFLFLMAGSVKEDKGGAGR